MRIISLFPECDAGNGSVKTLARFSVDIGPLTLHHMSLKQKPDGAFRVTSPNLRGTNVVTISPDLAEQISAAALTAWRARAHACRV